MDIDMEFLHNGLPQRPRESKKVIVTPQLTAIKEPKITKTLC